MIKEPTFPTKTPIKSHPPVTRSQLRVLWHLKHGAIVETYLGAFPQARMWTKDMAEHLSTRTMTALRDKLLVRPLGQGKSIRDRHRHRGRWALTSKGRKLLERYP